MLNDHDLARVVLVTVLTVAVVVGLSWLFKRSKPATLSGQSGTIRPELWSAWLTVLAGSLVFVLGLWALIYADEGWGAAATALFGAAIAGFMAPSVTSVHAVHWNDNGIEGPAKIFGLTLGVARAEIAWADIAGIGKTITGYWYVESGDGRRVYWSYLYKGYGSLMLALQRHCPSVQLRF